MRLGSVNNRDKKLISGAVLTEKSGAGFAPLGRWPPLMAIFMSEAVSAVGAAVVFKQPLAEGVSVDSQSLSGFGEVVVVAAHNLEDEILFELLHCFFEKDAASDHLVYQQFKFGSHRLPSVGNACRDRLKPSCRATLGSNNRYYFRGHGESAESVNDYASNGKS
jgi:hypothetical protein